MESDSDIKVPNDLPWELLQYHRIAHVLSSGLTDRIVLLRNKAVVLGNYKIEEVFKTIPPFCPFVSDLIFL